MSEFPFPYHRVTAPQKVLTSGVTRILGIPMEMLNHCDNGNRKQCGDLPFLLRFPLGAVRWPWYRC